MCSTMPRIYTVACALMLAGARGFVVNPALRAPCANRGIGTEAAGQRSLSMVSRRMYPALSSPARGDAVVLWGLGTYVALWNGQRGLLCVRPLTMSDVSMLLGPWTRLKGCMFCGCGLPPIKEPRGYSHVVDVRCRNTTEVPDGSFLTRCWFVWYHVSCVGHENW